MIPDIEFGSGMKPKWYRVYMKNFQNELVLERSLTNYRARNRTAENQRKTRLTCANLDVTRSRSRMSFGFRLRDSGIGSRTGMKVSIRNENPVRTRSGMTSHSFRTHVNTVHSDAELEEGE